MFSETADLYDLIYSSFKDYRAEAAALARILEERRPGTRTVLDVGSGTGRHAELLRSEHGLSVDGIDLEPAFVAIAAARNPEGRFVRGDMRDFDLGRRYDAVVCLFSAIGYVKTLANLERALRCFRAHLVDDGIVLVEPWFPPEAFRNGNVAVNAARTDGLVVARVSRSEVEGRISRLHFEYLIGRPTGIERRSEVHELGLFTEAETLAAFRTAGLDGEYLPEALADRGLYVGRRTGEPVNRRSGGQPIG